MMRAPSGIVVAAHPVRVAGAVPALVMVENPVGDRLDAEALEHAEADLRMALEHEPLGLAEHARLAEDLLGDGELAEVVQAGREPRQLGLGLVEPEPAGDPGGEVADPLGVAAGVGVARVDGLGEAGGRAVARRTVGTLGELLQVGELERARLVRAGAVLALLLRPVERAVREPDQLVAADALRRVRRDAGAHRHGADLLEVERPDPLDDRLRDRDGRAVVEPGEEDGELVAAEAEALAALAEPGGDLPEHPVAGGVAEAVVDPLEVVDVDEAEAEVLALVLGGGQLALQPLVEVAVVAEPRERVGQRQPHRPQRGEGRPLVERDREQRPDERDRQRGRALPQHDEHQRGRRHQPERRRRLAHGAPDELEERLPGARRDDRGDQGDVEDLVDEGAERDLQDQRAGRVAVDLGDDQPAPERAERERRAVVRDAQQRLPSDQARDRRRARGDEDTGLPAEEDDRRDGEDEDERDAGVHALDRHGEPLGDHHDDEESADREQLTQAVGRPGERPGSGNGGRNPRNTHGDREREDSARKGVGVAHRPTTAGATGRSESVARSKGAGEAAVPSTT